MKTLIKKELQYYLNNPIGYLIVVLFAGFANFMFVKDIFLIGSASMRPLFSILPWLTIIFVPALAMRSFSEEKRLNTMEILLTLPISETSIVLSKFISLLLLIVMSYLLTLSTPLTLSLITPLYLPEVLTGYFGNFLFASLCVALSMYFSSLTKNQIVSFLLSSISLFLLLGFSSEFLSSILPKVIQDILLPFGPLFHLETFIKGVLDVRSIVYFLSFQLLILFIIIVNLEKRD